MRIPKCFKLVLTSGVEVKIEEEEIIKIAEATKNGSSIFLKQAFVQNPNTMSVVVEDVQRRGKFLDDIRYLEGDEREAKIKAGIPPLQDLFESIRNTNASLSSGVKQLKGNGK
jgi:hypothetical protein